MDQSVRRVTRHQQHGDYQRQSPVPPTAQGSLTASSETSLLGTSTGNTISRHAVHSTSGYLSSIQDRDRDDDGNYQHHGMDTLIDSLPESVLREVLKSVAHLSPIQEVLSTASTLSAPSTPVLGSSSPAMPVLASSGAPTPPRFGIYPNQESKFSPITSESSASRPRIKRAASLSPTRSPLQVRPVVKKPTLADATVAAPLAQSYSREASPHRHFARHTEVRRGYLRQTTHVEGSVGHSGGSSVSRGSTPIAAGNSRRDSSSTQQQQQQQQQQAVESKIRRGLLQYIHRANLYYHGTLDTKDAVISLLNIANFALEPKSVLIKSPASQRSRSVAASSNPQTSVSQQRQQAKATADAHQRQTPGNMHDHHHLPYTQQHLLRQQQPSPVTPQVSRSGTNLSMAQSPLHEVSDYIRDSSPTSRGRASLLPTPHASPSISSASPGFAGSSRRLHPDEVMARMANQDKDGGRRSSVPASTSTPDRTTAAASTEQPQQPPRSSVITTQPHQRFERGIVPIEREILSSLTMILLHHPSQKQRRALAIKQGNNADDIETTEDGCDLEDWLLEAVYNLLEHERYKGHAMAEALSEYIVQVALARERRYRSQRMQYEQQQYPSQQYQLQQHASQQRDEQRQQEEEVEEEEGQSHHDRVDEGMERYTSKESPGTPIDTQLEAEPEEALKDDVNAEENVEEDQGLERRGVHYKGQREIRAAPQNRNFASPLYSHASLQWPGNLDSSDIGDILASEIVGAPSEPPSELTTDLPPSEPPTELGEPIKLVMHSEDCFGTVGAGEDGSVGNNSFQHHRNQEAADEDDEDEDGNDGNHEDDVFAATSDLKARDGAMIMAMGDDDGLMDHPPSDLPSEVHDISRIDIASDLDPLLHELARDEASDHLYPLDQEEVAEEPDDEQKDSIQHRGSPFLVPTGNFLPPPSED
ncbi:hypothetical protein BGW42_004065 [Actinomortierella wolfii]|nr:hypothetical protein BGW42_004065 [Actinomortierella wolfii]